VLLFLVLSSARSLSLSSDDGVEKASCNFNCVDHFVSMNNRFVNPKQYPMMTPTNDPVVRIFHTLDNNCCCADKLLGGNPK
jgi:hypothetical protein